ncbi:hypothetical protein M404DRAFT_866075 [Pisolithus tinctorius Marx 270]|uniref:Uncharacterized protein n=1 Tax=Pisolithus tinctorius Marx 270 TaxID=870435 RepID=A0A0C3NA78_PISTI|nr:hypothetical protein M404DRAFT_866075 [Pisolithus tinctorius Marx 270]
MLRVNLQQILPKIDPDLVSRQWYLLLPSNMEFRKGGKWLFFPLGLSLITRSHVQMRALPHTLEERNSDVRELVLSKLMHVGQCSRWSPSSPDVFVGCRVGLCP